MLSVRVCRKYFEDIDKFCFGVSKHFVFQNFSLRTNKIYLFYILFIFESLKNICSLSRNTEEQERVRHETRRAPEYVGHVS